MNIKNISDITDLIKKCVNDGKKVLLIADIDDTLIRPDTNIGTDPWFKYAMEHNNIDEVRRLLSLVYGMLKFKAVEPATNEFVEYLRSTNEVNSFCLTARHVMFHSNTVEHLKDAKFHDVFVKTNILNVKNFLSVNPDPNDPSTPLVRYLDNICSSSGQNKGNVILDLFRSIDNTDKFMFDQFDMIIFLDDSIKNIQHVHHALKLYNEESEMNFSSMSIHYTYMEDHKNTYSIHDFVDDTEMLKKIISLQSILNKKN